MKRIFFLAFFILVFQNVQAENPALSEAYETEIIEKVKSVFRAKEIEKKVERPMCATPLFMEIRHNWDRFSAKTKAILESYVERPPFNFPEHTYDTPQGHFKIHYVTQGDSAVPNEAWVNTCGEVLEYIWNAEIDSLGYKKPPSDGWYPDTLDNGGDGKYDVYLVDLSLQYLGYTQGEYFVSSSVSATSFIVLDNDYVGYGSIHSRIEWLQVTAAHEFFHAIQMGYDATEYEYENERFRPYWMEMSAVWMEDIVYDDVNDYLGYLSAFFDEPWLSLKTFRNQLDRHPYGSCVWPIFLSEKFDTLIVKDIWEKCAEKQGDNVIEATDAALRERDRRSTFEDAFREFTVWNYFTANRALPDLFYSEGDLFYYHGTAAMVKVDAVHTEYPVNVTSIPNPPENLGANYVRFVPVPELQGGINMGFDGDDSARYVVSAVGYNPGYPVPFDTTFLINPGTQAGVGEVCNWTGYTQVTEVIMIPAVITRSPNQSFAYQYSADYDSLCGGEPLDKDEVLQNFPNPFVIKSESDLTYFPFVLKAPSRVRIDILTLSGERIKTIVPEPDVEWGGGKYLYLDKIINLAIPWDGKNEEGEYVTSGIYLYRFRTDRTTAIKKMAVIR